MSPASGMYGLRDFTRINHILHGVYKEEQGGFPKVLISSYALSSLQCPVSGNTCPSQA
jgi:hypothetical protein